jgi:hypothetical protein
MAKCCTSTLELRGKCSRLQKKFVVDKDWRKFTQVLEGGLDNQRHDGSKRSF